MRDIPEKREGDVRDIAERREGGVRGSPLFCDKYPACHFRDQR